MMCLNPKINVEHICQSDKGNTAEVKPADFILFHGKDLYSRLIQLGQSLRFHGADRVYNQFTHVALCVNETTLIEATSKGVHVVSIDKYQDIPYFHICIDASDADRQEAVQFAGSCIAQGYGWTTILSIGFSLLTGLKLSVGIDGQEICSGLVARSLERTSAIFPRDPSHISPAELGKYYFEAQRALVE